MPSCHAISRSENPYFLAMHAYPLRRGDVTLVQRFVKREFDAKLKKFTRLIIFQRRHQVANDFGARRMTLVSVYLNSRMRTASVIYVG